MGVRFIRVHGRVIPIRDRSKAEQHTVSPIVKLAAAAAVATGTYLALRKFRPSLNPMLGKLQNTVEKNADNIGLLTEVPGSVWSRLQQAVFGIRTNRRAGVYLNYGGFIPGLKATQINGERVAKILHDPAKFLSRVPASAKPRTEILKDAITRGAKLKNMLIKERSGGMRTVGEFKLSAKALKNPSKYIAQQKLVLTGEYRVHVLNGEAFGISHRYNPSKTIRKLMPGGGAFVPVMNPLKRKEIREFVRKNYPKLNGHSFAGLDIGQTAKGLKILEANPAPGTFLNPIVSRQFKRLATGRWGKDVAGGAGLVTGGTTYAALNRRKK